MVPLPDAWLTFHPDQSRYEKDAISWILFLLPWLFAVSFLPVANGPLNALAAIPLVAAAPVLFSITIPLTGGAIALLKSVGIARNTLPRRIQSPVQQLVLLALCFFTLRHGGMAGRMAAAAWIGVVIMNAVAAVVLFLWRARVDELDARLRQCVGA